MALLAACVSDVGDIDRTDPDKLRKADFKGVWFYQMTVIEAPVPSPVTFNGEQNFGGGASVIFDIQQDYLVAYPVSELYVLNSEKEWRKAKIRNYWDKDRSHEFMEIYVGAPVAAFKIDSHFDVKRDYNTSTGEQSNVISENTKDRKWFEREYIRVDWSTNYVKDLMFLAGVSGSPVDYHVPEYEVDNPDRFHMSEDALHFVVKVFLEPVSPTACSIYDLAPYDCAGAVVKIRQSFRKVDPNNDYVPLYYSNDTHEDRFGFFLTTRQAFDKDFGVIYGNKRYYIQRWNLWESSRDKLPITVDGTPVACRQTSDCEAHANFGGKKNQVHCWLDDGWWTQGHCVTWNPIAYHDRTPKPIVYHMSANWPKELWDVCYRTADVWSKPFKETVAWLKTYSEFGLYDIKYCESHADCKNSDILADLAVQERHARRCKADDDCKTSASALNRCRGDGYCVQTVACSAAAPCPTNQLCSQGVCRQAAAGISNPDPAKDTDWVRVEPFVSDQGAYTVYYVNGAEGPEFKTVIDSPIPFVETGTVRVSLVHLNSFAGDVILQDDNGTVCRNNDGSDRWFSYIGGNAPISTDSCIVDLGGATSRVRSFRAVDMSSGSTLAVYNYVTLTEGQVYTFALVGDSASSRLIHGVTRGSTQTSPRIGLRLAHAASGRGAVDFGLNGSLRFGKVAFGTITDYTGTTQQDNRLVLTKAGANGDVTCFRNQGIGMCMGWRSPNTDAIMKRYAEIFNALPPMFVGCENVYTGHLCTEAQRGDMSLLNDCRYWYQDEAGEWRNPCGEVDGAENLKMHGDIRYNLMYWVPEDQTASPLGYGPSAADPETGEVYFGVANIYGAAMVSYGQYASDLLDASRGALTKENLMTGDYVKEFVENKPNVNKNDTLYAPHSVDPREMQRRKAIVPEVERFWLTTQEHRELQSLHQNYEVLRSITDPRQMWKTAAAAAPPGMSAEQRDARLKKMQGTWVEGLLMNQEVQNAVRISEGVGEGPLSDSLLAKASPMNWASPQVVNQYKERMNKLALNNYYHQELVEPYIYNTALEVDKHCKDPANRAEFNWTETQCRHWTITKWILYGTMHHEVGHTIGLRHNFQASADAFNYMDGYYTRRDLDYRRCFIDGPDGCAFQDTCRIFCDEDADCMPGTTCLEVVSGGQTVKACVDQYLKPTGWCWGTRTQRTECTTATDCAALGDKVACEKNAEQNWGFCSAAVKAEGGICKAGTLLGEDGYCVRDDQCDTAKKVCNMDSSRSCTKDVDCQLVYQIVETESAFQPTKEYVPRGHLTQNEIENGRQEYQYSSLMDYGGTINFDIHDIGKYDERAIRFGYGELIDVYTNTHKLDSALKQVASYYGYSDDVYLNWYKDTEGFTQTWFNQFLYLNDFIGVKENLERVPAPFRKVLLERIALDQYDRGAYDLSYRVVPHKYRGDEWRGNLETYVFDVGADMMEIAHHSWNKLHEYYVFDAFKRERWGAFKGASPLGYYNRILDRWMGPLADTGRYYSLFFNVFRPWPTYRRQFEGDIMRLGAWRETAEFALTSLVQLLTSPAPGSFKRVDVGTPDERLVNYSRSMNAPGSELNVPIGEGKFPFTTYMEDAGYYYFDHASFIGSFWEKVAAINTLTYSIGYFVGDSMGEQVDVGVGSSIGFNTNFYTELTNIMAGMVVGNRDYYSPFVDAGNTLRFARPISPWVGAGMPRVETSVESLTMKAYVALFSYAYLPTGFDASFMDSLFLCIKGNGSCYDIAGPDEFDNPVFGLDTVEFTDPWSKKTYVAKSGMYDSRRLDAAYWLLNESNDRVAEWKALKGDDSAEAVARRSALEGELRETIDLLDMIYTFNERYGLLHY
jgi:hypothetical protein